jgi:nicotinamidase-related amidase
LKESIILKQTFFQKEEIKMRIELLVIDPQNDFCDPSGALYVPGAEKDMELLAEMVDKIGHKFFDIHATVDSHHLVDIAHPIFWNNSEGKNPDPFTIITVDDVKNGTWKATNPPMQPRALEYVQHLAANGRYPLCIWPPHCLIGSWGYGVYPRLYESFLKWEESFAMVDYVTKGSNFWTEHYSAVQADVPDPEDPDTQLNLREGGLIDTLQKADIILLAGEARSHCLANTVKDIADNFGEENVKKMKLLGDATSDVPGFEDLGENFVSEMTKRGMEVTDTVKFANKLS